MKHNRREAVEFGLNGALSTDIPDRPKSRTSKEAVIALAAAAVFFGAAFGLSQAAKAETGFTIPGINSTLPAFAQTAAAPAVKSDDDQSIAALRSYAQSLGAAQPASLKGQTKVAEADNLDGLAEPAEEQRPRRPGDQPAERRGQRQPPAGRSSRRRRQGLRGLPCDPDRGIQKDPDGPHQHHRSRRKFACENCHGPGSAHAAAGGGRGVGGIMSFEADDPRTSEEKNGICLACHERGQRTILGRAASTKSAVSPASIATRS